MIRENYLRRLVYQFPVLLIGMIFLFALGLTGCELRGISGSTVLTPAALRTLAAMPPTPSATASPTTALVTEEVAQTPEVIVETIAEPVQEETPVPEEPTESEMGETPTPTQTATLGTVTPTSNLPTRKPTSTRYPTRTRTPTPTSTPPVAEMRIIRPGPYSRVVSPIQLSADVRVGEDGFVYLDIIGEDGRYILQEALDFRSYRNRSITIAEEVTFDIDAAAELARLVLTTRDTKGRFLSIFSEELVLLQIGDTMNETPLLYEEAYLIRSPRTNEVVKGGVMRIIGLAKPVNDNPLIFELVDENGTVVSSTEVDMGQPYGDLSHVPFEVNLPYTVTQSTPVLLTLRQESAGRIPGTVLLITRAIVLEP